jgi:hypothetical protein
MCVISRFGCMATLCVLIGARYAHLPDQDAIGAWHTLQAPGIMSWSGENSPEQPIVLGYVCVGGLDIKILHRELAVS